jgi:hypothetical protein
LQKEQTRAKQEPFFGRLGLKKWKAKYYLIDTNDEDCSEANIETLSITESSYRAAEYPNQICEPLTEGSKVLAKLMSLFRQSRKRDNQLYGTLEVLKRNIRILVANMEKVIEKKEALDLDIEKILERCKEAEIMQMQPNLLAVKCD